MGVSAIPDCKRLKMFAHGFAEFINSSAFGFFMLIQFLFYPTSVQFFFQFFIR